MHDHKYRTFVSVVFFMSFLFQFSACGKKESGGPSTQTRKPLQRPATLTPAQWVAEWAAQLPVEASLVRQLRHKLPVLSGQQGRAIYKLSIRLKNQSEYKIEAKESLFLIETSSKDPNAKPGPVLQVTGAKFNKPPVEDYSGCAEIAPREDQNNLVPLFIMSNTWDGLKLRNAQTRSPNGGYIRVMASYIEREDGLPGASGLPGYGSAQRGQTISTDTELELWVMVNPARLDRVVAISPVISVVSDNGPSADFRYLLTFSKPAGLAGAWQLSDRELLPLTDEGLTAIIIEGPEWRRIAGVAWASKYGKQGAETALARIAGSQGESDNIRSAALVALARLKSKEGLAQALAIASSPSANPDVRESAIQTLGTYEDMSAVALLVSLLSEKNEDLVDKAIDSLGRIKDAKSVQALVALLQDSARGKYHESAGRALQRVAGPPDVPSLLAIAGKTPGTSAFAVVAVIGGIDSPEALDALREFAASGTPKIRAAACSGLARLVRPQSLDTLEKLAGDPSAEVRAAAIRAIINISDRNQRLAAIHRAAAGRHPEVLTDIVTHGSYTKELVPEVVSLLARTDVATEVRARAAEELGNSLPPAALDGLLAALKDRIPEVRKAAAEAVGGFRDPRVVESLVPLLSDKDFEVQRGAATGLGRTRDPHAFEFLLRYAKADGFAQEEAVSSLGMLNDPRAIEPLVAWVQEDVVNTSHPAGEGLERLTGESFGLEKAQWGRWWKEKKAKLTAPPVSP